MGVSAPASARGLERFVTRRRSAKCFSTERRGPVSSAVFQSVDPKDLVDKLLIDVANPLDRSRR
jgi:hypothetical protein